MKVYIGLGDVIVGVEFYLESPDHESGPVPFVTNVYLGEDNQHDLLPFLSTKTIDRIHRAFSEHKCSPFFDNKLIMPDWRV